MAYTPLKISIADPCHEDWNGMHPVAGTTARHCDSCAKNVVDFTSFTDAQMNAYVRLNGGKMCGRFRPDQLGRPLRAVSKPTRNPLKIAATAAGLMLAASACETAGAAQNASASEAFQFIELVEGSVHESPILGGISMEDIERPTTCPPPPPSADSPIMGKIHPPMPPMENIDEPEIIDYDMVGEYVIEEAEWPEELPVTIEEVPAFADTLIPISSGDHFPSLINEGPVPGFSISSYIDVELASQAVHEADPRRSPNEGMLMGLISYQRPEPTGLDWVKDSLLKTILPPSSAPQTTASHPRPRPNDLPQHLKNLTVYPNPFVSELVVAVDLPHAQTMVVELLDPNGRRVHVESFEGIEGTNNFVIEPKRRKLVHAAYHLRVTDLLGQVVTRTVVR